MFENNEITCYGFDASFYLSKYGNYRIGSMTGMDTIVGKDPVYALEQIANYQSFLLQLKMKLEELNRISYA
jgi:hypothetical protein